MSPWASPIVVIKEYTPEGAPQQFCLCIDYRKLNSLLPAVTPAMDTKKGAFAFMPLQKISELFALLKGVRYVTALDLWSGYYHIKLNEESIPKSAFTTVFGKYEFLRCPFGLSQGPDFYPPYLWSLWTQQGLYSRSRPWIFGISRWHPDLQQNWQITPKNVRQSLKMFTQSWTQNQVEQMFLL